MVSSPQFTIKGDIDPEQSKILTEEACHFLAVLHRSFESTRQGLLQTRKNRQKKFDEGEFPDFLPETKHVRDDIRWRGPPPAPGLADRRVEITGPTDRKMIVNALNSEVYAYMADFEGKLLQCSVNSTLEDPTLTFPHKIHLRQLGKTSFRVKSTCMMP